MTPFNVGTDSRPKMAFCVTCQKEQPTVKRFVPPDLRRKKRICLFCDKPVEVELKYRNVPRRCGLGQMHQSTLEAAHCDKAHLMQKAGVIRNLQAHPQQRFDLEVNGVHITTYVADFVWTWADSGRREVADSKGAIKEIYSAKKRLMKAVLDVEILELGRSW
jgi:hypothetical protein